MLIFKFTTFFVARVVRLKMVEEATEIEVELEDDFLKLDTAKCQEGSPMPSPRAGKKGFQTFESD